MIGVVAHHRPAAEGHDSGAVAAGRHRAGHRHGRRVEPERSHGGRRGRTTRPACPFLSLPDVPFTAETLRIIAPYALAVALVGLMESLMTAKLVDDITDTHSNKTRESWGQGVANIVTGFFGGMGGCAMIGQTMINVRVRRADAAVDAAGRSLPVDPGGRAGPGRRDHPDGSAGRRHDHRCRVDLRLAQPAHARGRCQRARPWSWSRPWPSW